MLGHPCSWLSIPALAQGHTLCWRETRAQENSAPPIELSVPTFHNYQVCSGQYGQWVVGREAAPKQESLLRTASGFCCFSMHPLCHHQLHCVLSSHPLQMGELTLRQA